MSGRPLPALTATWHPASLLLFWFALVLGLQWLPLDALFGLAGLILPAALMYCRKRLRLLLRRARWLLLSIALLFCFATPGLALPAPAGSLGLTHEGLAMAATHALRLTLLLALLAMLQQRLTIPALIAGLYHLLAPLGNSALRSRFALRLLLVLEYLEQGVDRLDWRTLLLQTDPGAESDIDPLAAYPKLELAVAPLSRSDRLLMFLALTGLAALWLQHG